MPIEVEELIRRGTDVPEEIRRRRQEMVVEYLRRYTIEHPCVWCTQAFIRKEINRRR